MDTIIEMTPEMNKPGTGIMSIPMSVHTGGALLRSLKTIDISSLPELDGMTVELFITFVAAHVRDNAIERLAHLGIDDIDTFLKDK